ncbi:hypothetical protein Q8A67_024113 [Cirrhinus molitorella]|uniref:Uncharacterized protein n=1 Tax=Cirrhinus molitorella TaxID=172907 RepID=A0AA88NXZ3_9TELE|nr:hypothetical protein Q8A67_024113 [Cirrhinus molitorella]
MTAWRSVINIKAAGRVHGAIRQPCARRSASGVLDEEAAAHKAPAEPPASVPHKQRDPFRPICRLQRSTSADVQPFPAASPSEPLMKIKQGEMCCSRSARAHLDVGRIWWRGFSSGGSRPGKDAGPRSKTGVTPKEWRGSSAELFLKSSLLKRYAKIPSHCA